MLKVVANANEIKFDFCRVSESQCTLVRYRFLMKYLVFTLGFCFRSWF